MNRAWPRDRSQIGVPFSGSMNFGPGGSQDPGTTRLDYARRLGGTLGCLAAGQGDAVGLYCAGQGFQKQIRPRRSASHLKLVLDELGNLKAGGPTGLPAALHEAAERIAQRALVIVISDLLMDPAELKQAIQHLRFRRHDVAVFHLLDQNEIDFQFDRPMRFVDLEGAPALLADPAIMALQYREAVQNWLAELARLFRDSAVEYHRVMLHEHYGDVLVRFLLGRQRGR